ncbi:hypothetical protein M422DRAFT_276749 [Sphaerobolus stellatus SS14]|uniref:C2H2-type domain-containing protein n=1 Tax=Sphaerobolus stellatus (strain SS14) TaxID=990650 RepID=A0A0C9UCG6_SPHS4|nr:hypothetical protein M422DRAFT_276749 [Sphaerobolus stellatus SS14]
MTLPASKQHLSSAELLHLKTYPGYPLAPSLPSSSDSSRGAYGNYVALQMNLANHDTGALANEHGILNLDFLHPSQEYVVDDIPETMWSYPLSYVEPHNLSLPSDELNKGGMGGTNYIRDLSNLSHTTSNSMNIETDTIQDAGTGQAGPSSSTAVVDDSDTPDVPTPQQHVILPPTQPATKNVDVYIKTFRTEEGTPFFKCLWKRCKGPTFWERGEIHMHVKAHIIKKTHECLCGSTFSNFQAAQKHCRNARSTGNICPTW